MALKKKENFTPEAEAKYNQQLSDLATANAAELSNAELQRNTANASLDLEYGKAIDTIKQKYSSVKSNYENQMLAKGMFRSSANISGQSGIDAESAQQQSNTQTELANKKSANDASITNLKNTQAAKVGSYTANKSAYINDLADKLYGNYLDTELKLKSLKGGSGGNPKSKPDDDPSKILSQAAVDTINAALTDYNNIMQKNNGAVDKSYREVQTIRSIYNAALSAPADDVTAQWTIKRIKPFLNNR